DVRLVSGFRSDTPRFPEDPVRWSGNSQNIIYAQALDSAVAASPAGAATRRRIAIHEVNLSGKDRLLQELTIAGRLTLLSDSSVMIQVPEGETVVLPLRAGGAETRLRPASVGFNSQPSFSGDGRWVAVRTNPNGTTNSELRALEVMRIDGS